MSRAVLLLATRKLFKSIFRIPTVLLRLVYIIKNCVFVQILSVSEGGRHSRSEQNNTSDKNQQRKHAWHDTLFFFRKPLASSTNPSNSTILHAIYSILHFSTLPRLKYSVAANRPLES